MSFLLKTLKVYKYINCRFKEKEIKSIFLSFIILFIVCFNIEFRTKKLARF